jgi:hypothetical protein
VYKLRLKPFGSDALWVRPSQPLFSLFLIFFPKILFLYVYLYFIWPPDFQKPLGLFVSLSCDWEIPWFVRNSTWLIMIWSWFVMLCKTYSCINNPLTNKGWLNTPKGLVCKHILTNPCGDSCHFYSCFVKTTLYLVSM